MAIIDSKNISIIANAKALKEGNLGDIIPIQINQKIFNAKIIKKGVVKIE